MYAKKLILYRAQEKSTFYNPSINQLVKNVNPPLQYADWIYKKSSYRGLFDEGARL
jgi:hypothetical protein